MFLSSRGASSGSMAPRKAWNADGVAEQALQLLNALPVALPSSDSAAASP